VLGLILAGGGYFTYLVTSDRDVLDTQTRNDDVRVVTG
jgi:hypothetical protein